MTVQEGADIRCQIFGARLGQVEIVPEGQSLSARHKSTARAIVTEKLVIVKNSDPVLPKCEVVKDLQQGPYLFFRCL